MLSYRFDAVVFDLDGTLIDSEPDLRAALNATLRDSGRAEVSRPEVIKMIGDGVPTLVERGYLATGGAPEMGLDAAVELFSSHYEGKTSELSTIFPGVEPALTDLAALGIDLGVCTNKPQKPTEEILDAFGLAPFFKAAVGGDALPGIRKPDGRHLGAVLDKLGTDKTRAAMVGDNHNDAATAQALGAPFIAVTFGYARGPVTELGADVIIHDFKDLIPALESLA